MKLTDDILEVLGGAHPDGNLLRLEGQLDRKLYEQVDAVLQTAGGRWDKRRKAHVFPGDAWQAVLTLTAQEEVTTVAEHRQATQFFPTPPAVVDDLLTAAQLRPGLEVLEPSAGEGAIAEAAVRRGCLVDCIELDTDRAARLEDRNNAVRLVTCADFLTVPPRPIYDRVIMNPPFTRGADIAHVTHALRFVKPGGRLVAVMSAGVRGNGGRAAARFRALVDESGWFTDLPAGAFDESGTPVRTVIVVIDVSRHRASGEPARVTFDRTADGAPLFSPRTAKPGVYVHRDAWTGADNRVFRFRGRCIGCGQPTWRHDDGNDDIRGAFGDNTAMPIDDEDIPELGPGATIPRCSLCWNERERYERAMSRARASLAAKPAKAGQLDIFAA